MTAVKIPALSRRKELRVPEGGAGEGSPAAAASLGAEDASAAAGASFEARDAPAAAGEMVEKGAAEDLSVRARRDLAMRDMARLARGARNVGGSSDFGLARAEGLRREGAD